MQKTSHNIQNPNSSKCACLSTQALSSKLRDRREAKCSEKEKSEHKEDTAHTCAPALEFRSAKAVIYVKGGAPFFVLTEESVIEVFFKPEFGINKSANAVQWQIGIALLIYALIRFLSQQRQWSHSFTRLFTLIRGVLWDKYCLVEHLLQSHGTAGSDFRLLAPPDQLYLPGFAPKT